MYLINLTSFPFKDEELFREHISRRLELDICKDFEVLVQLRNHIPILFFRDEDSFLGL